MSTHARLLSVLVLTAPSLADPIIFRFEGTAEVTLNGVPHPGSHYIIELQADTDDVVVKPWGYDLDGAATFEIVGVASGTFDIPTRIFNNTGGPIAGFSKSETIGGHDLIDFVSPLLAGYALNVPLGPIFDPNPTATHQFFEIPTSAGPLSLEALDVTFTAVMDSCYPDCNADGALNLGDFGCFQTKFALSDPYADCNGDGNLNLGDFGCFQTKFALGCP